MHNITNHQKQTRCSQYGDVDGTATVGCYQSSGTLLILLLLGPARAVCAGPTVVWRVTRPQDCSCSLETAHHINHTEVQVSDTVLQMLSVAARHGSRAASTMLRTQGAKGRPLMQQRLALASAMPQQRLMSSYKFGSNAVFMDQWPISVANTVVNVCPQVSLTHCELLPRNINHLS
jgi:hypothetical protein